MPELPNLTEFQAKIVDLYQQGKTMDEMAQILGRSVSSITSAIWLIRKTSKVSLPKRNQSSGIPKTQSVSLTPKQQALIRYYKEGLSFPAIGKALGISTNAATNCAKRLRDRGHLKLDRLPRLNATNSQEGTLFRFNPATGTFKKITESGPNSSTLRAALNILASCRAQLDHATELLKRP